MLVHGILRVGGRNFEAPIALEAKFPMTSCSPKTSCDSVADPSISPEASSCWLGSHIGTVEGALLDTPRKVCCA